MKVPVPFAKPLSWASLLLIIIPPLLYLAGAMQAGPMNAVMLAGTFVWFISASLWMGSE